MKGRLLVLYYTGTGNQDQGPLSPYPDIADYNLFNHVYSSLIQPHPSQILCISAAAMKALKSG